MTENLRLVGSRTLTSANSDVTSNFTLPASAGGVWGTGSDWNDVSKITDTEINTAHVYNTGNSTYGIYYNWYAATAGTGTASVTSGNAPSTICPKGWTIPTRTGTKSWYNLLITKYGYNETDNTYNAKVIAAPISLVYPGYLLWYNGTIINQGNFGMYWTKTAVNRGFATILQFVDEWGLRPRHDGHPKAFGFSVRCVSK